MSEFTPNPNRITSENLLIDENETELSARRDDARSLISLADLALPINNVDNVVLSSHDQLSIQAKSSVDSIKAFFSDDSDFAVNEGLRSMGAKLAESEWCDNSKLMQEVELVLRLNDLSKSTEYDGLYNRLVTTVAWLRAAKMAQDDLLQTKSSWKIDAQEVADLVNGNPTYLESAYKDLLNNNAEKFTHFMDFMKESGQSLETALPAVNIPETNTQTTETLSQPTYRKDTIIGDDVEQLDKCMTDAHLVQLAMIPAPYEAVVDVMDLPEKQATAYVLEQAYRSLEDFAGHSYDHSGEELYSIDHGLRALNDKLGDPHYHGPQYDIQAITFGLRFNQLFGNVDVTSEGIEHAKNIATYMRAAVIAEKELSKTKGFLVSSTEVAERANDPAILERAWDELSAYDNAMFNEFFGKMKQISSTFANGLQTAQEHPEWRI